MEVIIPYEYITFVIFSINYSFENKKIIKYSTLKEIYNTILEELIKNYHDISPNRKLYFLDDKWDTEPIFKTKSFFEVITLLLNKYPNYFTTNNNALILKDNIKYEDLIIEITKIEQEMKSIQRFYDAIYSDKIFKILNITTIKNILTKYLKIEHDIENAYMSNLKTLPPLLFIRELFLYDLGNIPEEKVDAFRYTSLTLEPVLKYSKLPINYETWKKCDYYVSPDVDEDGSIIFDIIPQLKSLYQYAIFGTDSIAEYKLSSLIEQISFRSDEEIDDIEEEIISEEEAEILITSEEENELDEEEEEPSTTSSRTYSSYLSPTIENIFFTTYLYELTNYLKTNSHPDLINAKNRLLYALDDGELELYKEENLIREYEANKIVEVEASDFDFLMIEAIFFCDEVFKNSLDDNTIKKLLFIKTYYHLTHDEEIKVIFNKYKNNPEYPFYANFVFGNNITLKRNLEGDIS